MFGRRTFTTALAAVVGASHPGRTAPAIPVVGILWHAGSAEQEGANYPALLRGFQDLGYRDGETIRLVHRFPNEQPENFRRMAAELVAMPVDVLVSVGANAAPYAKQATSAIPIVFTLVSDPLGTGLVANLARPGGNVTGFSNSARDVIGKRLELLKELLPGLSHAALLVNGAAAVAPEYKQTFTTAAAALGLQAGAFDWREPSQLQPAFADMKRAGVAGIIIAPDGAGYTFRDSIARLAIENRMALSGWSRDILKAGALMTYGASQVDLCRRTAIYVDRLLKGAKPGDLPVQQPAKFELLLNQQTAKAIGIALPTGLLDRADEVIE